MANITLLYGNITLIIDVVTPQKAKGIYKRSNDLLDISRTSVMYVEWRTFTTSTQDVNFTRNSNFLKFQFVLC